MRCTLLFTVFLYGSLGLFAANDHIIFRNGQEGEIKVTQITKEYVRYVLPKEKTKIEKSIPTTEIYMVNIENEGNMYFTKEGKRITGEKQSTDLKNFDLIYLTKGAEIEAQNIRITEDAVIYTVRNKAKGAKKKFVELSIPLEDVFFIRYRNGRTDLITSVENIPEEEIVEEEIVPEEPEEPQLVSVYHDVVAGDTLDKLAKKYSVTVEQLREWNDIPKSFKSTRVLAKGMCIVILQPKQ